MTYFLKISVLNCYSCSSAKYDRLYLLFIVVCGTCPDSSQGGLCVCGSLILLSVASADASAIAKIIIVSFVPNTKQTKNSEALYPLRKKNRKLTQDIKKKIKIT